MLKGEFIRSLKGSWNLKPVKGGTLLSHSIDIKPEVPDVLTPLFLDLSEENLSRSMKILRNLMLESSTSQPLGALMLPDN